MTVRIAPSILAADFARLADEIARVQWFPAAEVRRMAVAGEIVDGLSLTALLWAMAAGRV